MVERSMVWSGQGCVLFHTRLHSYLSVVLILWPLAELHDDGREKTEHHQSHADHESLRLLFDTHFNLRLGVRHPPNPRALGAREF